MNTDEITVTFLDVGQGDSTVILLPDSLEAIVVDCPPTKATLSYIEQKNISTLHVFITHTDMDHMGGAATLIENFEQVASLAYNHDTFLIAEDKSKRRTILRHLARLLDQREIDSFSPRAGNSWNFQGVRVEALHPHDRDIKRTVPRGDTNNASVVLLVTFAQQRVLLTADIEGEGWQWIMERNTRIQAEVLKFPHHGAWYNASGNQPTLDEILQQISPILVILSVGTNNNHKHPRLKTLQLLQAHANLRFVCTEATEQCYSILKNMPQRTYSCAGTVEVVIGKNGIRVIPDVIQHARVIASFDNAQCK